MTLNEISERFKAAEEAMVNNITRELYADAAFAGYKKPSAYEAFKYRVVSRIKAAVRWATYWAWEDQL